MELPGGAGLTQYCGPRAPQYRHRLRPACHAAVLKAHQRTELIKGMRSIVVHPYLVFYRPGDAVVEIVRVLHGRRDLDAIFADG